MALMGEMGAVRAILLFRCSGLFFEARRNDRLKEGHHGS
jgi:hypothetical protein